MDSDSKLYLENSHEGFHKINFLFSKDKASEDALTRQKQLNDIIRQLRKTIKEMNIKPGEIINCSGEHYRVMISPYRVTLELRFPDNNKLI